MKIKNADLFVTASIVGIGLLAFLVGCLPLKEMRDKVADKIDVDISVDYYPSGTDEPPYKLFEVDNVEEILC